YAFLLHAVAVANGNGMVLFGLVVNGYAEGRANGVLAAVALANAVLFLVIAVEIGFALVKKVPGYFREAVLFGERQYGQLDGGQPWRELQHHAAVLLFGGAQVLLFVGVAYGEQEHAVQADGGFYYVRDVVLVCFRVKVLQLFAAVLLVVL